MVCGGGEKDFMRCSRGQKTEGESYGILERGGDILDGIKIPMDEQNVSKGWPRVIKILGHTKEGDLGPPCTKCIVGLHRLA